MARIIDVGRGRRLLVGRQGDAAAPRSPAGGRYLVVAGSRGPAAIVGSSLALMVSGAGVIKAITPIARRCAVSGGSRGMAYGRHMAGVHCDGRLRWPGPMTRCGWPYRFESETMHRNSFARERLSFGLLARYGHPVSTRRGGRTGKLGAASFVALWDPMPWGYLADPNSPRPAVAADAAA